MQEKSKLHRFFF